MKRKAPLWLIATGLAFTGAPSVTAQAALDPAKTSASDDSGDFFLQKVHPLLESKCFGCHGEPKDREAEFDMRTREGLVKGGESGKAGLVPLRVDGWSKVASGLTTVEEVVRVIQE